MQAGDDDDDAPDGLAVRAQKEFQKRLAFLNRQKDPNVLSCVSLARVHPSFVTGVIGGSSRGASLFPHPLLGRSCARPANHPNSGRIGLLHHCILSLYFILFRHGRMMYTSERGGRRL